MISVEDYLKNLQYKDNLLTYSRRISREVNIGGVPVGGDNPIRVQSMTTANTMDTEATVEETIRLIEAGCEYVRITAPSKKEAENLENIKNTLRKRGYDVPLIADIHFTPNAAEIAARIVEKVRINPGNYADKKKFDFKSYEDDEYKREIERIRKRFTPLINVCKENGTAMRIGTNHGSLSDRIMGQYGDTPIGMVESAMEFLRICRDENFHDIVLSMKASNPMVMVQAYRLLVAKMDEEKMDYPLHLGVTEAGDGNEGRIKSAVGIGSLLEDGIGDTVRVSLTEKSEAEIPVARKLIDRYKDRPGHPPVHVLDSTGNTDLATFNPYEFNKRKSRHILNIGGEEEARVMADLSDLPELSEFYLRATGHHLIGENQWTKTDLAADFLYLGNLIPDFQPPEEAAVVIDYKIWTDAGKPENLYPLIKSAEYEGAEYSETINFLDVSAESLTPGLLQAADKQGKTVLLLSISNPHAVAGLREVFRYLEKKQLQIPVMLRRAYHKTESDAFLLCSATDTGSLFIDGWGDGLMLQFRSDQQPDTMLKTKKSVNEVAFQILQAARARITTTEYISCPSCGRTLFDLEETTAMIRDKTSHLKGVRIGVMGCIVNGPGEMADADYGYVGTGPGKITLYKGKEVVKRNIDSKNALDELIELIKADGKWVEPVEH